LFIRQGGSGQSFWRRDGPDHFPPKNACATKPQAGREETDMPGTRAVDIKEQKDVYKDFFRLREVIFSYGLPDGRASTEQRRLVFERGNSVGVLLLNRDSEKLVLVKQFRIATYGDGRDGWMIETVAGIVEKGEGLETAAIRETLEETGYQIGKPTPIATFFSSPGGTSERISLYFAEVRDADKRGPGGGDDQEAIEIELMTPDELLKQVKGGKIEDPKLIIGAYWLEQQRLGVRREPAPEPRPGPLSHSTVKYYIAGRPQRDQIVGYKTGNIAKVEGVHVWVNSENEDMMMDRLIGRTISANIRYLGAEKDGQGNIREDTIANALHKALGRRLQVRIGTVIETEAGALTAKGVRRILHVATVRIVGGDRAVKADLDDLGRCIEAVLTTVHRKNESFWRRKVLRNVDKSILIPLLGAGDGGLRVTDVAEKILLQAVEFFKMHPTTALQEIYFVAYSSRDKAACDQVLEQLCARGVLERVS